MMCDNIPGLTQMKEDVFRLRSPNRRCNQGTPLNIALFQEEIRI